MEEAAKADYAVIIDKGKIIASDTPGNLVNKYSSSKLIIKPKDKYTGFKNEKFRKKNDTLVFPVADCFEALKKAEKHKDGIEYFEIVHGNMDDVFIELTGSGLREDS
jgi:multidrug/hemolysin transport system ATP-binding protein